MSSRDIHSRDGGKNIRDLLASFLATILLGIDTKRPMYLISPWLSDFKLFDNIFGQFRDLFKSQIDIAENVDIFFSETLIEISDRIPIRIITWPDEKSRAFIKLFNNECNISIKIEKAQKDHQKGLLSELFYFEGSMNFTYSGIYINREKITCNASFDPEGNRKINEAYLEFERIWNNLDSSVD